MNLSFGTKLFIGFIVSYILLNVFFQFILTSPPSWNVRHMKKLLRSLEPTETDKSVLQMSSPSPYAAEIHKWWDNGRWIKELVHKMRQNMKIGWQILDWVYWPVRLFIRLWNKMENIYGMLMDGTGRIYREITHHLPI